MTHKVRFDGQLLPVTHALDLLMRQMDAEQAAAWISRRMQSDRFIAIPEAN